MNMYKNQHFFINTNRILQINLTILYYIVFFNKYNNISTFILIDYIVCKISVIK
jgi:hypothetical protein